MAQLRGALTFRAAVVGHDGAVGGAMCSPLPCRLRWPGWRSSAPGITAAWQRGAAARCSPLVCRPRRWPGWPSALRNVPFVLALPLAMMAQQRGVLTFCVTAVGQVHRSFVVLSSSLVMVAQSRGEDDTTKERCTPM